MHSLIDTIDVADFLRQPDSYKFQAAIDLAHALVASEIGTTTLEERAVVDTLDLYDNRDLIIVSDGPIASVEEVLINNQAAVLSGFRVGKWTISRRSDDLWLAGATNQISFTAGYRGPHDSAGPNVPEQIRQALIITAAMIYKNPDATMLSERIGDYSYMRQQASSGKFGALPPEAQVLLRNYKRPPL